jgi:uncharacterized phosphosugar-binding protein
MKAWQKYFKGIQECVDKVYQSQGDNLARAAEICVECVKNDGIIHTFGCGHSSLVCTDVFWRASTLANVHQIFESATSGSNEITKTSKIERLEGLGQLIVDYQRIGEHDILIAVSNSGNNAVTVDVVRRFKELGHKVIAITNVDYADKLTTAHSCGKKLKDLADVILDNCSAYGDATVELEGLEMKVGGSSTIPQVYLMNALLVQTCEDLLEQGIIPDVYYNGHLAYESDKVKKNNDGLVDKYFYRMRNL